MKKLATVLALLLATVSALACDDAGARKVQTMLGGMGTWQTTGKVVEFKWGPDIDSATPRERLKLIEAFANADACLTGSPREIEFYRKGKLIGRASPNSGIRLTN